MGLSGADLEPAERTGVIAVTAERIAFRHPLVRSAAYHAGTIPPSGARRTGPWPRRWAGVTVVRGIWLALGLGPDEEAARGL